jgi:hypothetical protein
VAEGEGSTPRPPQGEEFEKTGRVQRKAAKPYKVVPSRCASPSPPVRRLNYTSTNFIFYVFGERSASEVPQ